MPVGFDSASSRWIDYLQDAGCRTKIVDIRANDIQDNLRGCDALMWRWAHFGGMYRVAKRILPIIERDIGLTVFPDQNTCWHYDDKIAQTSLFKANDIPHPTTHVFFDIEPALRWIGQADFPIVAKLATGAGSENVTLIENPDQAKRLARRLFRRFYQVLPGTGRFALPFSPKARRDKGFEPQAGYVFFQEFLEGNAFDTRVVIIGRRAFAFRRINRKNDFRASGSGDIDFNPGEIDPRFIRLAFDCALKLGMQTCAIDGLYRRGEPVIGEVSYTFVSGVVNKCPGHWRLVADPMNGDLVWQDGPMWAEEAQVYDLVSKIKERGRTP